MSEEPSKDEFPSEEAMNRFNIFLRAIVGRTDFTSDEREVLADIRRRNGGSDDKS